MADATLSIAGFKFPQSHRKKITSFASDCLAWNQQNILKLRSYSMFRGARFAELLLLPPRYGLHWSRHNLSYRPLHYQNSTAPLPPLRTVDTVTIRPTNPLPNELLVLLETVLASTDKDDVSQIVKGSPLLLDHLLNGDKVRELAVALARTHLPQRSLQIIRLAHVLGCRLKQNVFECTAHQLASNKQWRRVLAVVGLGIECSDQTTLRLMNWRTRALVEEQNYSALANILAEFRRYNVSPNRRTFHLLLTGHIRNNDLHQAKICLQCMMTSNYPPDASTYALLATVFRPLGIDPQVHAQAIEALPSVQGQGSTSTAVLNSLLQMHLDARHPSDVLNILSLFDQCTAGSAVAATYKSSAFAAESNSQVDNQPSIYRPPNLPRIYPDAGTFTILLNYAATRGDFTSAMQYLQIMETTGVKYTADTVTSLLHVLFATGNDVTALQLVSEVCGARTAHLFRRLSNVSSTRTLPIPVAGILPTTQMFNALLKGILRSNGFDQWSVILQIMRAHGLQPNSTTAEVLVTYLDKVECARTRDLLRLLRFISHSKVKLNLRHMHVILRSIFRREKYLLHGSGWNVKAVKFSKHRQDDSSSTVERISSVTDTFDPTAGIQLTNHHRYRALARPLLQSLATRKVKSDSAMIALRIWHDGVMRNDLDSARDVFHTLLTRGIRPNAYHFSALMEGHTYVGDILGAEEVMQSAIEAGLAPNAVMFTILIVGHARKGKPHLALRTFQRMLAVGIKPDVPAIDAVASAFFAVGAYRMARRVLIDLWHHISPFPSELANVPLYDLARHFRKLHCTNRDTIVEPLTKRKRRMLHWQLRRLRKLWVLSLTNRIRRLGSSTATSLSTRSSLL